jgi:hypothetical protein
MLGEMNLSRHAATDLLAAASRSVFSRYTRTWPARGLALAGSHPRQVVQGEMQLEAVQSASFTLTCIGKVLKSSVLSTFAIVFSEA